MINKSSSQETGGEGNLQSINGPDIAKRRRVLLGGSVGAILATVKSGSALAGGQCVSPSAFSSITANPQTSNRPQTFGQCSSRGFYGNNGVNPSILDSRWMPVIRSSSTLANSGFPANGPWPASTKLYDIIKAGGNSLWNPDGNLVVMYLDVMTGKGGGVMAVGDVMDMWSILFGAGTANPKYSGWTADTVRSFYNVWTNPNSGF
ncbi:MAG TPA: hypothetical protein VN639_06700 [Azonexus sp.]|nr:hypothetical protein [Azonexus sp.]